MLSYQQVQEKNLQEFILSRVLVNSSKKDREIGHLENIVIVKNTMIRKLKKTLQHNRRQEVYEPYSSRLINNFLYYWKEHYICRHFLNGDCHVSDKNCRRLHCSVNKRILLRDFRNIRTRNRAIFIEDLLNEAIIKNWASKKFIYEIREYMYHIA